MIRPRRTMACAVVVFLLALLGGCQAMAPVALAVGGALVAVGDAYCRAISEPGKRALRDRLTGGRTVIACAAEGR